ncbi:cytochrome c3 family protein [Nitrospirota bacterium]
MSEMKEGLLKEILKKYKEGIPMKLKILAAVIVLIGLVVAGTVGYGVFNYTQTNPNFCVSCHLMQDAFDAWDKSAHKDVNCHDCHHLAIPELNALMVSFIFHRPEEVPSRHGKVIVPWKYCIKCHWETKEGFEEAPPINRSSIHSKHYFTEQFECSKCHGYLLHEFVPEPRYCTECHGEKSVHGAGMEGFACLSCHSDESKDLRPQRANCLTCHGTPDDTAAMLSEESGIPEGKNYRPTEEQIAAATKINISKDAPMQFDCYQCHKPHEQVRPDWGNCIDCHRNVLKVGKHKLHIESMGMECSSCHKPHSWTVTKAQAKQDCVACHSYKSPESFLSR